MKKIKKLFLELDKELNILNDKEMGEMQLWETIIAPLRELGGKIGVSYFEHYMVLGLKSYPQDPNDYGIVNEADNPMLLSYRTAIKLAEKVNATKKEHGIKDNFALIVKVTGDF
ncbi:hypothetical protein LCGC14_2262550 [marine sediment metagenome]|uniref:Uncharacterized protein n=1 Tax=marine sediment metagenome TaxID=412755 RepID=A0A0F9FU89_9ZZZZ